MVNVYKLRVYPAGMSREVDRVLEICGGDTLDRLCESILEAFDFIHEHLYEFCMDNKMYSDYSYQYDPEYSGAPNTKTKIDKIGLHKGQNFSLHYDFGDDWMFTIHVQSITQASEYFRPRLLKGKGSIKQYPSWDDDEDDEWDDEWDDEDVDEDEWDDEDFDEDEWDDEDFGEDEWDDEWDDKDVAKDKDHVRFLRVKIRDGVLDIEPYKPNGELFDYSGFTGTCRKLEYEGTEEEDVILVRFDQESLARFPKEYIQHSEEMDAEWDAYFFYKKELIIIEWK